MRLWTLVFLPLLLLPRALQAQQFSTADQATLKTLRSRYYKLLDAGFGGMQCKVKFNLTTVPLISPSPLDPVRALLQKTDISLAVDTKGNPNVQLHYPEGTSPADIKQASQIFGLMRAFVAGVFQTWPSKAFHGPIPPYDSQIESIMPTPLGRTITLLVPGGPVQVLLDKQDNVTAIVSAGGKLQEHPVYSPGPAGLDFTANEAIDDTQTARSTIKYEFGIGVVDGLRVPQSVHLMVNDNIDVRYVLEACTIKKVVVIHVDPALTK